jgi:hypothetical protein
MAKLRTDRLFFRNGQTRYEYQKVGGQLHGFSRTWHYNGQLAEELRYRHGLLHGLCRQWDEHGHLLGSFTMDSGTGRQRYWHTNGLLKDEINSFNGKFFGRMRHWLRDGTLVHESYYICNMDVSRAEYLNAARKHPEWPQHQEESKGKVARKGAALERKTYELFIQSLVEKSNAEAGNWLREAQQPNARSLARFRTAKAAFRFVESLYAAGADTVIVVPIYAGKREQLFADSLLIRLPKKPSKRKALLKLCRAFCDNRGGAFLPEEDGGESHIFLGLE